jgi:hypothetical protein
MAVEASKVVLGFFYPLNIDVSDFAGRRVFKEPRVDVPILLNLGIFGRQLTVNAFQTFDVASKQRI